MLCLAKHELLIQDMEGVIRVSLPTANLNLKK